MYSTDILWLETVTWREVQAAVDHHMQLYAGRIDFLTFVADSIADHLQALDPVMDAICAATCTRCPNPCCLHADVRYDFRDILFLHCRHEGLPLHQPKLTTGWSCSFLDLDGCALPRSLRPFLCNWYLCPGQMQIVRGDSSPDMAHVLQSLQSIQQQRKDLEDEFIRLVLMHTRQSKAL